jgi:glycosyltransferase involved in cell wall biosynthesis
MNVMSREKEKYCLGRTKVFGYEKQGVFSFLMLRRFCKNHKIDVVTNLSGRSVLGYTLAFATVFSKTKNIFYNHGTLNYRDLIKTIPVQFLLDKVLFCSPDIVEASKKVLFFSVHKIFTLEIPIDTDFFRPLEKSFCRSKLSLGKDEKVLLHVSRVFPLKGSKNLLELIKRNPDKKFVLVGELMDEEFKKEKFENVVFVKDVSKEDLVCYYNAADLFLFLSKREGYGLPPREAMSCGTPAFVSDIIALRLISKAVKVPDDPDVIQEEIESFFKLSDGERKVFSEESRKCIVEEYPRERIDKDHVVCFLNFS